MKVVSTTKRTAESIGWGIVLTATFALAAGTFAQAPPRLARVTRIDGATFDAGLVQCCSNETAIFSSPSGDTRVTLDELSTVRFSTVNVLAPGSAVFHLADGGRLSGELSGGDAQSLTAKAIGDAELRLPFSTLAGVQLVPAEGFEKSNELFEAALAARFPGQDVLVTRGPDEMKSLRGRMETLGATSGSFVFGDKSRTFQNEKIFGVVFAKGTGKNPAFPATVELLDGGEFSGRIESADATHVRIQASFGTTLELGVDRIARLLFRSPRVTYLSDLTPVTERTDGRMHRPWAWRRDRSVTNAALSIDGRSFDRGLGMHARTELEYELDSGYEFFVATIGIDDAARPSGSVLFRVLGDAKSLFESEVLTGGDPPKDVRVEVKGIKKLTLIADYGDELDLSDHADWGGARLIKGGGRTP